MRIHEELFFLFEFANRKRTFESKGNNNNNNIENEILIVQFHF